MKRIGPELKMSELKNVKVPPFLSDLYYDLRDRRLLPLVVLILVAIVAMPFLLGGGSEDMEPAPRSIGGDATESTAASSLTVVEAQPGLRDYRQRLANRTATNPFKQRFTGPAGDGGLPTVETSTSSLPSSEGEGTSSPLPAETAPAPAPEGPAPSGDGGDVAPGDLRLFTFGVDVKISSVRTNANGKKEKNEPEVREEVVPPAPLPSAKTQVVTYMGISPKTQNPLLLVSDDVEAIFGEGKCISGSESCQLLEVELGLPTTFVYEPTGARFKINVLKVEPVFKGRFED